MDEIERSLGRIEAKIDGLNERMDRQHDGVYGPGGLEPRLRVVEQDVVAAKAKAGLISTGISIVVAVAAQFVPWIFKK